MANWTASKIPSQRCRSAVVTGTGGLGLQDARTTRSGWRNRLAALGVLLSCTFAMGSALAQSQPKPDWSLADMPSQEGRIFLVTGGTSGMGYEDAKALAAAGAQVVIAARNPQRGQESIDRLKQEVPDAQVQFESVDLAYLSSVRALGQRLGTTLPRLDGLINNAAIMAPPERGTSPDGFEMQLATNYAGHFVLTAELLPLLRKSDSPRGHPVQRRRSPRQHQFRRPSIHSGLRPVCGLCPIQAGVSDVRT